MRRTLLSSCGYLVLMLAASNLSVSSAQAQSTQDQAVGPTTILSFEGGYLFNDSSSNVHFDPDNDKIGNHLGNLDSLTPGKDGGQFRFELGQVYESGWDYKVALGAILLDNDDTSGEYEYSCGLFCADTDIATAEQKQKLGIADLELGFRPDTSLGGLDVRFFGGIRAIRSSNEGQFEADKVGSYDDSLWAVGPRIGLDAVLPIEDQHQLSFVGSLSGSVLFGDRSTDESLTTIIGPLSRSFSESETVWNVDAMAGLQMPVGERASLTLGYKAQQFWNLVSGRSDVESFFGTYTDEGNKDVLVHGPFLKLTVEVPPVSR